MNLSESLGWMKTLKGRHAELIALRDQNSRTTFVRYMGAGETREETKPVYDTKALDRRVTLLAREIRLLDEAIKRTNAKVEVEGFTRDENVLGELS